jgi:hypothetical protein
MHTEIPIVGEDIKQLFKEAEAKNVPKVVWNPTSSGMSLAEKESLENAPDGKWCVHFFPSRFNRPFTGYQKDFHNWGDTIVRNERPRPRIECEPRGVGKSTNTRGLVVKLLAKKQKFYVLYVGATDGQAQKHFNAIKSMMEVDKLLDAYPHLKPQAQKHRPNVNKNWSSERLVTEAGQVVEFLSLLGNARGFTTEEGQRPDLIILDDIDDSDDSPYMVRKKLDILKYSVLPAKAENTLVIMPQNLIHRDSICQQIKDQRADILSDRIFVGAYPLMKWYEAEKVDVANDDSGAKRWVITAGEVFDEAISIEYCEQLLNDAGKDSFDRECQQEVFKVGADKDFREWNELYHIVTYSEFRTYWEQFNVNIWNEVTDHPIIPHNWNVGQGFDWGTTIGHPSAIASIARPNMNVPLSDSFFVFCETILPEYPLMSYDDVPLVSPGRVVNKLRSDMYRWGVSESQVKEKLMSHEASAALNTMAIDLKDDLKEYFSKWKAQKGSGVPQVQNLLEIDKSKPHPFRKHPETGNDIMGCPRIFFLVPDDQGKLIVDSLGKLFVAQPINADGFARARFELPLYSQFNSGQNKTDDDFVDGFRGIMNVFGVVAQRITKIEAFTNQMQSQGLDYAQIEAIEDEDTRKARSQRRAIEDRAFSQKQKPSLPRYMRIGRR